MPISGRAMSETLNFPTTATIQAVMVVPRLAPMITPIDWIKVSRPALTKETTSTVVADDDWTSEVVKKPVKMPLKRFPVMVDSAWRMRLPASRCTASDRIFIPNRKTPRAPRTWSRPTTTETVEMLATKGMRT
jgi:hypothetical protein